MSNEFLIKAKKLIEEYKSKGRNAIEMNKVLNRIELLAKKDPKNRKKYEKMIIWCWKDAINLEKKSLKEGFSDHYELAWLYEGLAKFYSKIGDIKNAEKYFRKARREDELHKKEWIKHKVL